MQTGQLIFKGTFWDFVRATVLAFILTILTGGLLFPYLLFKGIQYFIQNTEIEIYETLNR